MPFQASARIQVLLLLICLGGCLAYGRGDRSTTVPAELSSSTLFPTESETMVDIVIDTSSTQQTIQLKVGQILRIKPPDLDRKWQIDYDPALFVPITTREDMQSPGTMSWQFKTIAPGEGQIILVSIVECASPPCPLIPARFQFNFQVQ